jgi:hypothetical protein
MEKIKISKIREQFPMYGDLSDEELVIGIRKKFYDDIPASKFYSQIDFDTQRLDPTSGMSTSEKFFAGMGKSAVDIFRSGKRIANKFGIGDYDEAAAAEDERLDKPLLNTGAGQVGKFVGDVATTAIPAFRAANVISQGVRAGSAILPRAIGSVTRGAAPYIGAAGSGAAVGAALSPEDMAEGAGTGALAGAVGEAGGRVLSAAYGGAKAALEPLTQTGRERVLRRTLERFATDPQAVRAAAQNPVQYVPGVIPTLAEATLDPGIAQLQRGAAAASSDVASALAESRGRQFSAYRNALDDLAGNDGTRQALEASRTATANALYGQARNQPLAFDQAMQGQIDSLLSRPSVQRAINRARVMARERGMQIDNPAGSAAGLMYVDDALGDQIGRAARAGDNNLASALRDTQDELRRLLEQALPDYGAARRTYAEMSRPINQMAIGQTLRDRALPALTDFSQGSLARVNANSYANALRNADATARTATGMRNARMADVLEPGQLQTVEGIGRDMARYATAQELGRVAGSPTAQYLGAQNVLRQFMGPLGIPQSAADSMAGRIAAGLMGLPFRLTQSRTEQLLGQALTDPAVAARIMQTRDPRTIAEILRPYVAQVAVQADTQ